MQEQARQPCYKKATFGAKYISYFKNNTEGIFTGDIYSGQAQRERSKPNFGEHISVKPKEYTEHKQSLVGQFTKKF